MPTTTANNSAVDRQLDGRGHALDEDLSDRLAGLDRLAQVAGGDVAQVEGELDWQGLGQAKALR